MFMRLTLTAASVLLITGCASLINDKDQKINVTTSNGTTIQGTVNGQPFTAPGVLSVARENKGKVFATNNPNCAKETAVEKTVDPIFFINVIVGGPLGSTTDYATEKMWKYADTVTISCK